MKVKLISYSKAAENGEQSIQDLVAYCARVSNPANQQNTETNEKLIETTRDIGRQILRHRSFSFQEFSQRYAVASLGFCPKEARLQDKKNRQNSIAVEDEALASEWEKQQQMVTETAEKAYNWALENNIAKEQARAVLPEGMTVSRMYMNGTLRSWVHYILLRRENGTQKEHQEVAIACGEVIQTIFPMIKDLL